jgi:16S rRNA pseudouridine516 synthase
MENSVRIDKYLCDMGKGSRSQIKEYLKKGFVNVNGAVVKAADCKVDTENDIILFNNEPVRYVNYEYIMLNKPAGVLTATTDKRTPTVMDLIKDCKRKDLFPVGRLDKDTVGLLLITNDGELCHNLLSPSKHVDKLYYAEISGCVTPDFIGKFKEGIILEDGTHRAYNT